MWPAGADTAGNGTGRQEDTKVVWGWPGLLESAYEASLCHELGLRGLRFERQKRVPLVYKGVTLDCGFVIDVLVEGRILVEVKAVEHLLPVHKAQGITYLKLARIETGLLVNFNAPTVVQGLRRLVRGRDFFESAT